jgi:four helix bundle protein
MGSATRFTSGGFCSLGFPDRPTVLGMLTGPLTAIERHDRDLGNQLRRAASSVALNIAEGSGSHGGTRLTRYRTALGSARETGACIDVAVALGYVEEVDEGLLERLDRVQAMLVRLVR